MSKYLAFLLALPLCAQVTSGSLDKRSRDTINTTIRNTAGWSRSGTTTSTTDTLNVSATVVSPIACAGTDDTAVIQAALDARANVQLPVGTCVATNLILTRANRLFGFGLASVLSQKTGATGYLLDCGGFACQVENITVDGGSLTDKSAATTTGTRHGVKISTLIKDSHIAHSILRGFTGAAISFAGDNTGVDATPAVSHSNIYQNGIGILTRVGSSGTAGEYLRIVGNSISLNSYGIDDYSGNVATVGNSITHNGIGVRILSDSNGGHGSLTGNIINHSARYSIWADTIPFGYTITGNQLFYGDLHFAGCAGFTVANNTIALSFSVELSGAGVNWMRNNWFYGAAQGFTATSGWVLTDNKNATGADIPVGGHSIQATFAETLGAETVTNGGFATDTGWTKQGNWTISGNVAHASGSGGSAGLMYQPGGILANTVYKITFTISNYVGGSLAIGLAGFYATPWHAANGAYVDYINTANSTDGNLYLISNAFQGDVDDVSITTWVAGNESVIVQGTSGVTAAGASGCTITAIKGGVITAATCTP